MPVTYETWLVLLSIVMAIQGAYVGLSLAVQIADASGVRRRLLLAGATVSLAVAIWTMHFVGMLAVRLPFQVDYLVLPTLLSFLVCAIVVGAAVYATSSGPLTLLRLTLSACLMGGGIFTMHYIGMSALDASTYMIHDPLLCRREHGDCYRRVRIGALARDPAGRATATDPVGDRPSALPFQACIIRRWPASPFIRMSPVVIRSAGAVDRPPRHRRRCRRHSVSLECFFCSFCPIRPARHRRLRSGPTRRHPVTTTTTTEMPTTPSTLPAGAEGETTPNSGAEPMRRSVARAHRRGALRVIFQSSASGARHFVAVEDVVAVHANAHYTYIFDGNDTLFCPLAIGDVGIAARQ